MSYSLSSWRFLCSLSGYIGQVSIAEIFDTRTEGSWERTMKCFMELTKILWIVYTPTGAGGQRIYPLDKRAIVTDQGTATSAEKSETWKFQHENVLDLTGGRIRILEIVLSLKACKASWIIKIKNKKTKRLYTEKRASQLQLQPGKPLKWHTIHPRNAIIWPKILDGFI